MEFKYGRRLMQGEGLKKDLPEAYKWFYRSACQNHAEATYFVSEFHERGRAE